jgi:hypothetical protein
MKVHMSLNVARDLAPSFSFDFGFVEEALEDYERAIMGAQHHCDLGYAQQLELPEFSRGGTYGNRSRNWAVNVIKGLKDTSLSRHELSKILRGQKHYRSKK